MKIASKSVIPILTYHSIDECGSVISVSCETFRRQMQFLHDETYNVISLGDLMMQVDSAQRLSPKTIVLTFDDGFQNFHTTALPILAEFGFPATVFLITDHCGKYNDWTGNIRSLKPLPLMDWNEISECLKHKIEFGSHTRTHPDLTKISIKAAELEVVGSKLTIEEKLGVAATNFAYPYGKYNEEVKNLIRDHFKTSCSTELGKYRIGEDRFTLKRLDAYYLSNQMVFRSLSSPNFDRYIKFRQTMRTLRAVLSQN